MALLKREACDEVAKLIGEEFDDVDAQIRRAIERSLNNVYLEFGRARPWNFLTSEATITTTDDVSDTVAVTNGSASVTGTDSVFTAAMDDGDYLFAINAHYGIETYTSATALTLDAAYQEATATEATAYIYKWRYHLPSNFFRMYRHGVVPHGEQPSEYMPEWRWNEEHRGTATGGGVPRYYRLPGETGSVYYNTGTVTISGTTVTGSGTTFPSDATDWRFRVPYVTVSSENFPQGYGYQVASRDSDTQLTLSRNYYNPQDFTTALSTGTAYELGPVGRPFIGFVENFPDSALPIRIGYQRDLELLLHDEDPILFRGGEWAVIHAAAQKCIEDLDLVSDKRIERIEKRAAKSVAEMLKNNPHTMDWEPLMRQHPQRRQTIRHRYGGRLWT